MISSKNRSNFDKFDIVVLLLIAGVFGYFMLFREVLEYGDSFQYLHQQPMREPIYSLLLQVLLFFFGEKYNVPLGIIQNILAIICIYWSYRLLSRIYRFGYLCKCGTVLFLMAPHLVTPIMSATHLIMTNGVMTEGITLSLYYVWMTMLLGIVTGYYHIDKQNEESEKALASQALRDATDRHTGKYHEVTMMLINLSLAFFLTLIRGQMRVCIIVWMLVAIYKLFIDKDKKVVTKAPYALLLLALLLFPAKSQITKLYNLAESGNYVDTVSSKPMLLANILYVSEIEDAQVITDADLRVAFEDMVAQAKEQRLTVEHASGSMIERALFHESGHEILNFEIIDPRMREVIFDRYGIDSSQFYKLMINEDALCGIMARQLLPQVAGRYIKNFFVIASMGYVRSIATEKMHISVVAIFLYLLALILSVVLMRRNQKRERTESYYVALTMIVVLLTISGMVCGTSLVIQCITRYMIYNMPYPYIVGMAMINEIIREKRRQKSLQTP